MTFWELLGKEKLFIMIFQRGIPGLAELSHSTIGSQVVGHVWADGGAQGAAQH